MSINPNIINKNIICNVFKSVMWYLNWSILGCIEYLTDTIKYGYHLIINHECYKKYAWLYVVIL